MRALLLLKIDQLRPPIGIRVISFKFFDCDPGSPWVRHHFVETRKFLHGNTRPEALTAPGRCLNEGALVVPGCVLNDAPKTIEMIVLGTRNHHFSAFRRWGTHPTPMARAPSALMRKPKMPPARNLNRQTRVKGYGFRVKG